MRPEHSSARRLVLAAIVLVLLTIGGGVLWLANAVHVARAETRAWREERSEAKIVGKTSDEIIAMYGKPYSAERGSNGGYTFIMYKQVKHGQYCGIVMKDDVAVKVGFDFQ